METFWLFHKIFLTRMTYKMIAYLCLWSQYWNHLLTNYSHITKSIDLSYTLTLLEEVFCCFSEDYMNSSVASLFAEIKFNVKNLKFKDNVFSYKNHDSFTEFVLIQPKCEIYPGRVDGKEFPSSFSKIASTSRSPLSCSFSRLNLFLNSFMAEFPII